MCYALLAGNQRYVYLALRIPSDKLVRRNPNEVYFFLSTFYSDSAR